MTTHSPEAESLDAAETVRRIAREQNLEFFFAQFVDMHGKPNAKLVPAHHLDDLLAEGAGFAGFAAGGIGQGPHDPDLIAMPDPSTLDPAMEATVARLACYDMRGLTRNLEFADALVTCDRAVFFRSMLETMAQERGLIATFMPKPFAHLTGSGCHFHMSLWDGQRNLGAVLRVVRLQQPHPDAAGPGRPHPCRRAPRPCRGRRGARAEA